MKPELSEALVEDLAQDIAKRGAETSSRKWSAAGKDKEEDPLLTARECAERIGLSETKVRDLVNAGLIKRAPGLSEIRVRKSVLDQFGK